MQKNHILKYTTLSPLFMSHSTFAANISPQNIPWYKIVLDTVSERALTLWATTSTRATESLAHYEAAISPKIEPLRTWYEANNANVNIIPSLMTVHILDFILIVLGIFLFGWFVLKSLA